MAEHAQQVKPSGEGCYETIKCAYNEYYDAVIGNSAAAWLRVRAAEIAQGATDRNLDVRLVHHQAPGWGSGVGFQSEGARYLHGERPIFLAARSLRPPKI